MFYFLISNSIFPYEKNSDFKINVFLFFLEIQKYTLGICTEGETKYSEVIRLIQDNCKKIVYTVAVLNT